MAVRKRFRVREGWGDDAFEVEERYKGAVLEKKRVTRQVMSDIWEDVTCVTVWDDEENRPHDIDLWPDSKGPNEAEVDATEEVKAKYEEYKIVRRIDYDARKRIAHAYEVADQINKGDRVKVVKGRTAKGTIGKVVWEMWGSYGMGYYASREKKLCVATSDKTEKKAAKNGKVYDRYVDVVWVWARNVDKLDKVEVDEEAIRKEVEEGYRGKTT